MAESDAQLVRLTLSGCERAAGELVERFERPVFSLIVRMVRDPALAEDLAQETFIKVLTRLSTYDDRYRFSSWIFKIAHNTVLDYLRRPNPVSHSLDSGGENVSGNGASPESQGASPFELAERGELAAALDAAIQQLQPDYREMVLLRYQEDLSYEEIADVLDLPVGTVKSYLHRARAQLARNMTASGWGREPALQPGPLVFRKAGRNP